MADPGFYSQPDPLSVAELCEIASATNGTPDLGARPISGVAPIASAGPSDLTFLQARKYRADLASSEAGACLLTEDLAAAAPEGMALLFVAEPQRAFAAVIDAFYPVPRASGVHKAAVVDPSAKLEEGVSIGAGAVIGADAEIGAETQIAAGVVIGPGVCIGRDCRIGANSTIEKALIGDRVLINPNVVIGSDGFGYVMGAEGHRKIGQIGRAIIQDDVEIGSGTTVERGALDDTVVGEGTKIDNLVQIAHNCRIGRHCVIVAQVGLAGSTVLEDFVVLGGQTAVAGHLTVGAGSMFAARSGITKSMPAGGIFGGAPARPVKEWMREVAAVAMLARREADKKKK